MPAPPLFQIEDLHVRVAGSDGQPGAEILRGVDLTVGAGEVHALMGPNGSGKSTLANALLGNPDYEVTRGRILFKGDDITDWATDDRGKAGIFLAFQYPQAIPGVSVINFLRQALSARKGIELSVLELRLAIMEWMERLDMDPSFADRYLNEGFSGGEKKRNEILQMAILEPEMAILDETDSGLDIDALKVVADGVHEVRRDRPGLGVLAITHYQRLLDHLRPDRVHILVDGRIVESGGPELASGSSARATTLALTTTTPNDAATATTSPLGTHPDRRSPGGRAPRLGQFAEARSVSGRAYCRPQRQRPPRRTHRRGGDPPGGPGAVALHRRPQARGHLHQNATEASTSWPAWGRAHLRPATPSCSPADPPTSSRGELAGSGTSCGGSPGRQGAST